MAALALLLSIASPSFAQVGKTFGKRAAPEGSKACERPEFFAKLTNLARVDRDVAYWSVLEIKAEVGATIPASSVLSNVAYRGDRLDAIRYEISELGAFRSSTIDYDDAEYFAVAPISGTLSWKKLPPPGKYDFALVVKAFDAERPELFDEILVAFAISIKLTPPPAPKIDLLQSVGDVSTFEPTDDVASPEAPQVASEPKYQEFYNDENLAFYRDPRYAKPLPEGLFGMRTISVPEDGFHNDQDRKRYVGLKGVADVLSQARSFDGLSRKLEPYSAAIFGSETTDDYGAPLDEHFRGGVHYQDRPRVVRVSFGQCDTLTVGRVDGYIVFTINKSRPFSSAEQLERSGAWQGGEIVQINVFYFDSREAVEILFHADGSPRRFQRCEFADAPTNLPVPLRPGKADETEAQPNKALVDDLKTILPTLVLYSTVWNRDGSVAERVDKVGR